MTEKITTTILPTRTELATTLIAPAMMQTRLAGPASPMLTRLENGQGPAGRSMDELPSDPLAYYILAKS